MTKLTKNELNMQQNIQTLFATPQSTLWVGSNYIIRIHFQNVSNNII